jgi:hypothetical protein
MSLAIVIRCTDQSSQYYPEVGGLVDGEAIGEEQQQLGPCIQPMDGRVPLDIGKTDKHRTSL